MHLMIDSRAFFLSGSRIELFCFSFTTCRTDDDDDDDDESWLILQTVETLPSSLFRFQRIDFDFTS